MKKLIFSFFAVLLITGCTPPKEEVEEDQKLSLEENKKISGIYHERNAEDVENILSEDFIGHYLQDDPIHKTWNREGHLNATNKYPDVYDSILLQVAEGSWVATRFIRIAPNYGTVEAMNFKRFENGKIAEIWEVFGPLTEEEDSESEDDE